MGRMSTLEAPVPAPKGAQTLLNGLAVIRLVADGVTGLSALQERTGLPRSTVHRLVQALRSEGYLRETGDGLALGSTLIELGFASLAGNPLAEVAAPLLREFGDQVQDTVHLAVEEYGSVLYLVKIPGRRGTELRSRVGTRMPLTRTGIGKALLLDDEHRWVSTWRTDTVAWGRATADAEREFLAKMARYRSGGYSYDVEENELDVRCVAAPVRGASGGIIGAVSVAATAGYMPADRMRTLVPQVRQVAGAIAGEMGYRGHR